ncbi:MAG: hypothetical protein WC623_13530 [Pedobacter sp.]|uniref:hypothetical protein n=1 Tax=Pedobacter sp. TaxID=1411316 RepID=UPI003567ADDD
MVYFSNIFNIDSSLLEHYGALDVSLVNDLPLFIDPFLLFGSTKEEYKKLHSNILDYVAFLKSKSSNLSKGELEAWYMFPEIKQNWLGYSVVGNGGRGLGKDFASAFSKNLDIIFNDLGKETITASSHIEKACLFNVGVGRDNISDFTTNLIYSFLLEYTQTFALQYLNDTQRLKIPVAKAYFDYRLERWMPKAYTLPYFNEDFILLTPKDILTKDDSWLNRNDLTKRFRDSVEGIPNERLRAEINNYFISNLPAPTKKKPKATAKEKAYAISKALIKFPEIINYYIKLKENTTISAKASAITNVSEIQNIFIKNVSDLIESLAENTDYFEKVKDQDSYDASLKRVLFLKKVIENNDGYRLFYYKNQPIKRESDIQVIFRLTWYSTEFDVNSETNNGRGPVDYKISKGSRDKTLVEFKLASNSKLKQNLAKQVEIYQQANDTKKSIKVILYFDAIELSNVKNILKSLKIDSEESIVLIDASKSNKQSASNVKI